MKKKMVTVGALLLSLLLLTACGAGETAATVKNKEKAKTSQESTVVKKEKKKELTAEELEQALAEQPLAVVEANYVVQSAKYKALYPDMLQAIIVNNTDQDIKNAVVVFAAWDENGLPVKIEGQFDFNDPTYLKKVQYEDINLVGGGRFGEESGYKLDDSLHIQTVKAIAISYETFEGEKWENPYYKDFKNIYEGKKLVWEE